MTALILAEHDNASIKDATLSTVTAAATYGDIHLLVAGSNCDAAADAASKIAGVTKVLVADDAIYAHPLAEELTPLLTSLAGDYDAILAPATTSGKNVMPRVAAALDIAQISEIVAVIDANTFQRPIYAGNSIATVQTSDAKKVITVRTTAFEKAASVGGSAAVEAVAATKLVPRCAFARGDCRPSIS